MNRVKKRLLEINIKINYGFQQYNSKKRRNTNFLSGNTKKSPSKYLTTCSLSSFMALKYGEHIPKMILKNGTKPQSKTPT